MAKSKLGLGYGSEFHLLRMLGRHRSAFDRQVLTALNSAVPNIEWLDAKNAGANNPDAEYICIDFMKEMIDYAALYAAWREIWPSSLGPNWDAVGKNGDEWLLVEAKAHPQEMISDCKAGTVSAKKISDQFQDIQRRHGISNAHDWQKKYYQKANRLLVLDFLLQHGIKAKLVFVYFINGYDQPGTNQNVKSQSDWQHLIDDQDSYLDIQSAALLKSHTVNVFVDCQ